MIHVVLPKLQIWPVIHFWIR